MLIWLKNFFSEKFSALEKTKIFSWIPVGILALVFIALFYYSLAAVTTVDLVHSSIPYKRFFVLLAWTTLFFAWLSWLPFWARLIFSLLIFTPSAFFLYVGFVFKLPYNNYTLIADIAETNWVEACSFVDFFGVAFLILFLAAIVVFPFLRERFVRAFRIRFSFCFVFRFF